MAFDPLSLIPVAIGALTSGAQNRQAAAQERAAASMTAEEIRRMRESDRRASEMYESLVRQGAFDQQRRVDAVNRQYDANTDVTAAKVVAPLANSHYRAGDGTLVNALRKVTERIATERTLAVENVRRQAWQDQLSAFEATRPRNAGQIAGLGLQQQRYAQSQYSNPAGLIAAAFGSGLFDNRTHNKIENGLPAGDPAIHENGKPRDYDEAGLEASYPLDPKKIARIFANASGLY